MVCPICGKNLKYINNFHLRTHGYNSEAEFRKDYPSVELKSESTKDNINNHLKKLNSDHELQSKKARNGWTQERRIRIS